MPASEEPFDILPAPQATRRNAPENPAARWHVLDASDRSTPDAPTTAYAPQTLLLSGLAGDDDETLETLQQAAAVFGWVVTPDPDYSLSAPENTDRREERRERLPWAAGRLALRRLHISADPKRAVNEPEAWKLLQRARTMSGNSGLPSVGLDHAVNLATSGIRWPVSMQAEDPQSPASAYAQPGSGGREPVKYVGPAPERGPDEDRATRRPVVALLDSGCGVHPWLTDVRRHVLDGHNQPIGLTDPTTDAEGYADLYGPLDGKADLASGHGTFLAGIVRQTCPTADIVAWRLFDGDGVAPESELLRALSQIADLLESGTAVDALVLALGYYHENPAELSLGHLMAETLLRIRRAGTTVVCAAGNDSSDVPFLPAALTRWNDDQSLVPQTDDAAPLISVGALNPNGTVALFSNSGPWVNCYAPGASVLSTTPPTNAGAQPTSRTKAYGLARETIDLDDSTSGFAIWSGTSFAAPYVAGAVVSRLEPLLPAPDAPSAVADIESVWRVVSALTLQQR